MAKEKFHAKDLRSFLKSKKIATLNELKETLGTTGTMTVFRKLKALGYRTSYSHRGSYYSLKDIPEFDAKGLWSWESVWFSKNGNLVETAREFIDQAETGFTTKELESILHVECKRALMNLHDSNRIERRKIFGVFVYLSSNPNKRKEQVLKREDRRADADVVISAEVAELSDELKAAIILFFTLLDEKQRRLYAGLESLKHGHGGDTKTAELLGMDVHTVAKGRRELFQGHIERNRVRGKGGGRKSVKKNARNRDED